NAQTPPETPLSIDLCPGAVYTAQQDGQTYTAPGSVQDTLFNAAANGCDSILVVTLNAEMAVTNPFTVNLCPGEVYTAEQDGQTYTAPGTVNDTLFNAAASGCDSVLVVTLNALSPPETPLSIDLCPGAVYTAQQDGQTYTAPGSVQDTLFNAAANGCDSILVVTLNLASAVSNPITIQLCPDEVYTAEQDGQTYPAPGMINDTLFNAAASGCDSVLIVTLELLMPVEEPISVNLCPNEVYTAQQNGQTYPAPGTVNDTLFNMAANGCDSILLVTLIAQSADSITIDTTTCSGDTLVINGTAYTESNPSGSDTFINQFGCDSTVFVNVTFDVVAVNIDAVNALCEDAIPVTLTATPAGGTWSGAVTSEQFDPALQGPGMHEVIYTAGGVCTGSDTIMVEVLALPTVDITSTASVCLESGVQTLTATPAGGAWSGAVTDDQFDPVVLGAGQHQVIYTYNDGQCTAADTALIQVFEVTVSCAMVQEESAPGAMDGIGSVEFSGGSGPYDVEWDGPVSGDSMVTNAGIIQIGDLVEGDYDILVTDLNGCTATCSFTITSSACLVTIDNLDTTNELCAGSADGSVEINPSFGQPPYAFSLDGVTYGPDSVFTGLPAGMYTAYVLDAGGCPASEPFEILAGPSPELMASDIEDASCGVNNGSVDLEVTGGTPPYSYSIDGVNYQQTNSFSGLPPGDTTIYLLDASSCGDTIVVTIGATGQPTIDVNVQDATCGGDDGSIEIIASGGAGGFTYSLDGVDYQASNLFDNLTAGSYTAHVKDAAECPNSMPANVNDEGGPDINALAITPTPCAVNDGEIVVDASGGTGDLLYSIDGVNYSPSNVFSGLASGNYTIYVIDDNDCESTIDTSVTTTDGPLFFMEQSSPTECGRDNGEIIVDASGGTGTLLYDLNGNGFGTDNEFLNLPPGDYTVTVQDDNGCTDIAEFTIDPSSGPTADPLIDSPEHCGMSDGAIILDAFGGAGVYQFWVNDQFVGGTDYIGNLPSDFYEIVVQDVAGCYDTVGIFLDEFGSPEIDAVALTEATCGADVA
ncbi:MAG: SprB repeat-containing protein, partial [Saprospiraceae bacterium]|nr:SprB repeat-containing protein [Saprospiraceae bacterium]